jgi:DNA-binding GntR family transcriptional regulator
LTSEAPARLSQTHRAYLEIRRRILNNDMLPNTQYLERELAAALKMSRTPVREALMRLGEERLVEVRPRHGVRVLPVSVRDVQEIYALLAELEAMAARMLANRRLSSEELARLEQAVAEMEAALARDDLIAWAAHDEIFHGLLAELSGSSRLTHFAGMLRGQVHRARMQTLRLRPKPTGSNRDHGAIVEAIRQRDGAAAAAILRRHRQQARAILLDLFAQRGIDAL